MTVKKILNHADGEITAIYDRYEYDKEKQKAIGTWDRKLRSILSGEKAKVVSIKTR